MQVLLEGYAIWVVQNRTSLNKRNLGKLRYKPPAKV